VAGALTACSGVGGSGDTLTIRWAWGLPDDAPSSKQAAAVIKEIEEKSGGKIKVVSYSNGSLFTEDQIPDAVQNNSIDLGTTGLHRWGGVEKSLTIGQVPFLFTASGDEQQSVDDGLTLAHGQFGTDVNAILGRHKAIAVGWGYYGFDEDMVNSKHPIVHPQDLDGLRMRSNGPVTDALFQKYGATAESLDSSEVYTEMQRGSIDGAYSGLTSIVSRKWYETGQYVLATHGGLTYNPVFANLDWWNGLTADQRSIISTAIADSEEAESSDVVAADQAALKTLADHNIQVTEATGALRTEWEEATKFQLDSYLQLAGADGQKLYSDITAGSSASSTASATATP